jgi:single-strand DNA-binding protein
MPALNKVQLIGNLGRDPETHFSAHGKKVCHFTLAVNRRSEGEPDWFLVEAWERLGEVCQQYLGKGRLVYIEGRLQTDRWNDDKGETHYRTKVVARQMQMLDRKPDEQEVTAEGGESE